MKNNKKINFAFTGDLTLGEEFIAYAEKHKIDYLSPFELIKSYYYDADIIISNFEGPIIQGNNKRDDVTTLVSNHNAIMKLFDKDKIFVLNLANNHIMDYGVESLNNTINIFKKNGCYYIGAGNNDEEANQELIIDYKDKKMAFLAFTSDEPFVRAIIASNNYPGCASILDINNAVKKIKHLKEIGIDIILVLLHWGHEFFLYPSSEQQSTAHLLSDAGADYIIGHHPHVVQGIERYKESLIIYSLGNFFFPPVRTINRRLQYQKKLSKEFMLIKSYIDDSRRIIFNIVGGEVTKNYLVTPFANNKQKKFQYKIEQLSEPLYLNNYKEFWYKYKIKRLKELHQESFIEVFKKIYTMPISELIKTISINDFKRNLIRLIKIFSFKNK